MKQCGTARRIFREPEKTYYVWIPVYFSPETGRHHRVLPDFIVPFKHFISNVIKASVHNDHHIDKCSFPSDSTRIRWNEWIRSLDPASLLASYILRPHTPYRFQNLWPLSQNDFA